MNFVRYADDFIITGSSKDLLEDEVKPLVERFLLERGLQLSPEKTCIAHIEDGFDFPGYFASIPRRQSGPGRTGARVNGLGGFLLFSCCLFLGRFDESWSRFWLAGFLGFGLGWSE